MCMLWRWVAMQRNVVCLGWAFAQVADRQRFTRSLGTMLTVLIEFEGSTTLLKLAFDLFHHKL
jgi:hypothetical protein